MLVGTGSLFAWAHTPKLARAEGRDPRVLVIVLRGALDGLGMVAPVGDPDWVSLRGDRALVLDGKPAALPLDSFFALNPAMPNLHRLYQAQQAIIVHARRRLIASGRISTARTSWRAGSPSQAQPTAAGSTARSRRSRRMDESIPQGSRAFAVGPVTPLVVRGTAPIMSWSPQRLLPASDDTQMRLLDLYRHTDAKLARAFEGRRDLATLARTGGIETMPLREGEAQPNIGRIREYVGNVASTAAKYLAQPNGPRVGAASFVGWDTHINEGAAGGQLAALLGALDEAIAAIEKTMADAWSETVIAVVTEFGRTARINGTDGTDHGTATVAVLAGGALKGGRVIADWPGLRPADLHEGRDLKPTIDLRAVLKGVLRDHLRVDEVALATSIFPGSDDAKPMAGLLA
jgi:Uncharacterized protein conserved in bacteria